MARRLIRTLEVFRLDGDTRRMVKTWHGDVTVNAEPLRASRSRYRRFGSHSTLAEAGPALAWPTSRRHKSLRLTWHVRRNWRARGPLFFGAAQRAMESLHASESDAFRTIIIHHGKVPVIDATGFAALESAIGALVRRKKIVVLAGPLPQPRSIFEKARLDETHAGAVHVVADLDAALKVVQTLPA